jgi:DNA processing protein
VHGDASLIQRDASPIVAVVGSRRPRVASTQLADAIASGLAASGATVISGLAIGVDGVAHRAALKQQGQTIAVLGSGVEWIHPKRHRGLAQRIMGGAGVVISEFAPEDRPWPWRFAARNRIIAALADYVVVVQAAERSGSLQTADHALELGIPVGVVPGGLDDPSFAGTSRLLRDGADAVVDAARVCRALSIQLCDTQSRHEFEEILMAPQRPDDIAEYCDQPLPRVLARLMELEVDGLVARLLDGRYANA